MIVYMLYHIRPRVELSDDEKLIGIYSSQEKATAAIQRLIGLPGFRDFPEGFEIFDHRLDVDGWTEGFISTREAD